MNSSVLSITKYKYGLSYSGILELSISFFETLTIPVLIAWSYTPDIFMSDSTLT